MLDGLMNPMMKKALGSLLRAGLMLVVPFFVSQGIWTTEEATATMATIATALAALLWSLYEKYASRQKLLTAAASEKPLSENEVEAKVAAGQAPPVTVAKTHVPYLDKTTRPPAA